jgi:DNA-directed RNA polymerase specialized sigma subunit
MQTKTTLTDTQRELVEKNTQLSRYMVYTKMRGFLSAQRMSLEDAVAYADAALCRSALTFDPERGVKFGAYAARLITKTLLYQARRNQKNSSFVEVSFDAPLRNMKGEETGSLHDLVPSSGGSDPCFSELWVKETLASIDPRLRSYFTGDKTQMEIARACGLSQSYISRLVVLERKRLQAILTADR